MLAVLLAQADGAAGGLGMLVPFLLIAVIFYFLMIRPQQKQADKHKQFVAGLKKGDEVTTNGGLIGRIVSVSDQFVSLEVANNVKIRVLKGAIAGEFRAAEDKPAEAAAEDKK